MNSGKKALATDCGKCLSFFMYLCTSPIIFHRPHEMPHNLI